jgi:hypothetical protein
MVAADPTLEEAAMISIVWGYAGPLGRPVANVNPGRPFLETQSDWNRFPRSFSPNRAGKSGPSGKDLLRKIARLGYNILTLGPIPLLMRRESPLTLPFSKIGRIAFFQKWSARKHPLKRGVE